MARTIRAGAVKVDFIAGSAKFVKESRKTQTRLQKFKRAAVKAAQTIRRNWAQIATAIAAFTAAIAVGLRKMTEYSATLVEASRQTGLTVKELERMRSLFQSDGIGIKRADKSFQEFSVRVGFAQRGIGQYTRAFEELGIVLTKDDGSFKSQNALFAEVAGKLRNMTSEAKATSIAYELFGRSGKELIPILRRYGAEIDEAAKHANRFRSVTAEQHEANKELDQQFTDMKENLSDFRDSVLSRFTEDLTGLVENFNEWVADLKQNKSTLDNFADGILKIADAVASLLAIVVGGKIGMKLGGMLGPKGKIIGGVTGAVAGWWLKEGLAESLRQATMTGLDKAIADLDDQIAAARKSQAGPGGLTVTPKSKARLEELERARAVLIAQRDLQKQSADMAAPAFEDAGETGKGGTGTKKTPSVIEKYERRWRWDDASRELFVKRRLDSLKTNRPIYIGYQKIEKGPFPDDAFGTFGHLDWDSIGLAMRQERERLSQRSVSASPIVSVEERRRRLEREASVRDSRSRGLWLSSAYDPTTGTMHSTQGFTNAAETLKEQLESVNPVVQDLGSSFERFAESAIDGFDNIGDAAKTLAKDLLRSLWRHHVSGPLTAALFGGDGFLAGLFPGKADGGLARGLTLVGERGPELVDFSRPGMVYTNEQLRSSMSGGGVSITYNIASTDGPGVQAALNEATPGIVARARADVAESATRRGAVRTMIRGRR